MKLPETQMDFEHDFQTEEQCLAHLAQVRWPDGFVCPRCGPADHWVVARGQLMCRSCQKQVSITAGTIFHRTRKPLVTWFRAMWWVVAQKSGVSALGLQRILGIRSYKTAWSWLHKFRRLMVVPGREKLTGTIEVDETIVGGKRPGKRGRGADGKVLVMIALEKTLHSTGRVRLAKIPNASKRSIEAFLGGNIEKGATIITDGWTGYRGLENLGFVHSVEDETYCFEGEHILPNVHRIASLLKRWLLGTHQTYVGAKTIDHYLEEFTFRHNRRRARSRALLFQKVLEQAVRHDPVSLEQIFESHH